MGAAQLSFENLKITSIVEEETDIRVEMDKNSRVLACVDIILCLSYVVDDTRNVYSRYESN